MKRLLSLTILMSLAAFIACAPAPSAPPGDEVTMEILDSAVTYIRANHPDASAYMPADIEFRLTGGTGKDIEGYSGVTYSGGGWVVSIGHAIVPNYAWDIEADYGNGKIVWIGTSRDGRITEESYTKSN